MRVRGRILGSIFALAVAVSAMSQTATPPQQPAGGAVIGKLGQSIIATKIYSTRSTSGRVYWTTKANDYLVVNTTDNPQWLSVILQNGTLGYVMADQVASLPYDVVVPEEQAARLRQQQTTTTTTTSRGSAPNRTSPGAEAGVQQMLNFSYQFVGTPYRWGGTSLTGGIDCSAFVQAVCKERGIRLPRTAAEQAKVGTPVERLEHLQPGDRLYFWDSRRRMIGHCGIFMGFFADGGAYFIHSSSNNRGVDTDDLRDAHWRNMLVGARRD
ncbi:MAG: C40 family peptidase [Fimbriimonadaceae bacterium]|nr:C40 family peptidase [Fimbriimonadaceae bacterium]